MAEAVPTHMVEVGKERELLGENFLYRADAYVAGSSYLIAAVDVIGSVVLNIRVLVSENGHKMFYLDLVDLRSGVNPWLTRVTIASSATNWERYFSTMVEAFKANAISIQTRGEKA